MSKFERKAFTIDFLPTEQRWGTEIEIGCYGEESQYTWEMTPKEALEVLNLLRSKEQEIIKLADGYN